MIFGTWKAGSHGATKIMLSEEALLFQWISGRVDILKWSDPNFDLTMVDRTTSGLARFTPLLWEARRWNRPTTALTQEAYVAILDAAKEHGMDFERKTPSKIVWGICELIRISAHSKVS
jgi:hypothetical protein